jgi:hypothetical protein
MFSAVLEPTTRRQPLRQGEPVTGPAHWRVVRSSRTDSDGLGEANATPSASPSFRVCTPLEPASNRKPARQGDLSLVLRRLGRRLPDAGTPTGSFQAASQVG